MEAEAHHEHFRLGRKSFETARPFGQSIWLDYIRRSLITSGELRKLIEQDGLAGMTSNPVHLRKGHRGRRGICRLPCRAPKDDSLDAKGIYERLAIRDIQDAAEALSPYTFACNGHDGYVSLEVSPLLAHKNARHIDEARRLWKPSPSQHDDQGAGHTRRAARHRNVIHRRHQRQYHSTVRAGNVRRSRRAYYAPSKPRAKAGHNCRGSQRRQLLRQPHRYECRRRIDELLVRGPCRTALLESVPQQSRDRQCQAGL